MNTKICRKQNKFYIKGLKKDKLEILKNKMNKVNLYYINLKT